MSNKTNNFLKRNYNKKEKNRIKRKSKFYNDDGTNLTMAAIGGFSFWRKFKK